MPADGPYPLSTYPLGTYPYKTHQVTSSHTSCIHISFLQLLSHMYCAAAPPPPPPPPRELGVHTLAVLEGHDNYVDIGGWAPGGDSLVTASTDK